MEDRDFEQFKEQMLKKTGIDLNQYKEAQMKRRLTSLRTKKGYHNFQSYFSALLHDPTLLDELLDRMTINVSEFFRNPERWQVLERKIVPDLLRERSNLKTWSAASSTGEEPYSLVMVLSQFMDVNHIKVKATDIDEASIEKAKAGTYIKRAVQHVPDVHLQTHFTQQNGLYHLSSAIKSRVHFQKHNLLADPFGSGFDLILCRNVLIYFTEEAKVVLYHKFSQALRPGGVLFVGSTEQIFHPETYGLEVIEPFFYRKMKNE